MERDFKLKRFYKFEAVLDKIKNVGLIWNIG